MGQEESIAGLCRRLVVTKSRTSVAPNRPDGVFLFVGPTGVGKTELARALCEYLTGSAENLIRLDMSEYADPASTRTLLGQPGGAHEAGQRVEMPYFTRALRDTPYSVVLLDEIEKAHPAIRLLFLHAIDTGQMRDNHGNTIYLTNAVIVMTSNAGYSTRKAIVTHPGRLARERAEQEREATMRVVKSVLPPEFLGRIDEILFFRQLTPAIMDKFIEQKVEYLERTLGKRILLDKDARALLREEGFSVEFGARELNRAVDSMLGYPLALFKSGEHWRRAATIQVTRKPGVNELEVRAPGGTGKARTGRKRSNRSDKSPRKQ